MNAMLHAVKIIAGLLASSVLQSTPGPTSKCCLSQKHVKIITRTSNHLTFMATYEAMRQLLIAGLLCVEDKAAFSGTAESPDIFASFDATS